MLSGERAAPPVGGVAWLRGLVADLGQALRDSGAVLASYQGMYRELLATQLRLIAERDGLMVQNGRLVQALLAVLDVGALPVDGPVCYPATRRTVDAALAAVQLDHAEEAALLQDLATAADAWDQAITNLNGIADSEATLRSLVVRWRRERARKAGS